MKCDAPEDVRAVKMTLRVASDRARAMRRYLASMRAAALQHIDPATGRYDPEANADDVHIGEVGAATLTSWAADAALASAAEAWRVCLADRMNLAPAERWDLAALEQWARAQP